MPRHAHACLASLLWRLGVTVLLLGACTEPIVFGHIPPAAFQFVNVVPHDGRGPSGWKVAQVTLLLGRLSPHYPATTTCDVEVGVPEETRSKGRIPDIMAQQAAAQAADEAARIVLSERLPTGVACIRFLDVMRARLSDGGLGGIPGAQVTQILHRYYPPGLWTHDPAYDASEQAQRLTRLLETAQRNPHPWEDFVQKVREELAGCTLWDMTLLWSEPCYRLRVYLPGAQRGDARDDAVVCLLSLLAPVYALYASHFLETGSRVESWTRYPPLPPGFQPHEAKLAGLIEASFGASRLSNEVLFAPVAGLAPRTGTRAPGEALMADLLLTHDRW